MAGTKMIPLNKIVQPDETMMRTKLNQDHVQRIAEAMKSGESIPPVDLFGPDENGVFISSRGHHRIAAATEAKLKAIRANIIPGGMKRAVLHAAAGDYDHGLPLSEADRRNKIIRLLNVDPDMPAAKIAKITHIRKSTVLETAKAFKNANRAAKGLPPEPDKPAREGAARGGRKKKPVPIEPPRSLPPTKADTSGKDEYGQPIPPDLLEVFLSGQGAISFATGLNKIAEDGRKFSEKTGGARLPSAIPGQLKAIAAAFDECYPVAIDPVCQGIGKDKDGKKCQQCGGRRWFNKKDLKDMPNVRRRLNAK